MMDITNKINRILNEVTMKDIPKEFMGDPLYKAVFNAKDQKSYDKALKTLLSIRGRGAVDALKHAMGKGKK